MKKDTISFTQFRNYILKFAQFSKITESPRYGQTNKMSNKNVVKVKFPFKTCTPENVYDTAKFVTKVLSSTKKKKGSDVYS